MTRRFASTRNSLLPHRLRGYSWQTKRQFARAIEDYAEAIKINPSDAEAYYLRGFSHQSLGDIDNALRDYEEAIRLDPKYTRPYNEIAWIRAACDRDQYRDGDEAVKYATIACELTDWKDWNYLDTLAAAYAEQGRFEEAKKWEKKAIALAPPARTETIQHRFELYEAEKPYREKNAMPEVPEPGSDESRESDESSP